MDTAILNFYNTDVEGDFTLSTNYLANFGTPYQSRIFSARPDREEFMFLDGFKKFNITPENTKHHNTQIPYTNRSYLTAGSKQNAEDRRVATLPGNINTTLGLGANFA